MRLAATPNSIINDYHQLANQMICTTTREACGLNVRNFSPAKLRIPKQLDGWSWRSKNLQHASRTDCICNKLEAGNKTCMWGRKWMKPPVVRTISLTRLKHFSLVLFLNECLPHATFHQLFIGQRSGKNLCQIEYVQSNWTSYLNIVFGDGNLSRICIIDELT